MDRENPLTPEQQEELHKYRESIESEFADSKERLVTQKRRAAEDLEDLLPDAVEQLGKLVRHSENENLRFKAATFIVTNVLGEKGVAKQDLVERFFEEMPNPSAHPNA